VDSLAGLDTAFNERARKCDREREQQHEGPDEGHDAVLHRSAEVAMVAKKDEETKQGGTGQSDETGEPGRAARRSSP
jgi:hypothetical protein